MKFRGVCASVASIASLLQGGVALAQEVADSEAIVVTAQKREQAVLDVPIAIDVFNAEELAQRGIQNIQDLSFNVPGLTMREDGPGSYQIFLRGLSNAYGGGGGAHVAVYEDETPLSLDGYNQLSPVPLDLARIEVLKGPQGTLYGQGAAGGTIRYVSNAPDLGAVGGSIYGEAYSVADGEMGTRLTGVFNLPLVENVLGLRIAADFEQGGGWIDQPEAGIEDGNGTELSNLRARLLWRASENFEADLTVRVHRAETQLGLGYEEPDRTNEVGIDRSNVLIPKEFEFETYGLTLNYDFGWATLVSATNYIDHDHQYPTSYLAAPGNFNYGYVEGTDDRYTTATQMTQEFRLTSNGDNRLDWTVGAFLRDAEFDFYDVYAYINSPTGELYTDPSTATLYAGNIYITHDESKSYSVFADASFALTDRLEVGAGVRYFHEEQDGSLSFGGPYSFASAEYDSTDPRVYFTYDTSPNTRIYGSVGTGFRSGGNNLASGNPGFDPESIITYELGAKGSIAGGAFDYDVAVFHTIYEDMVRRGLVLVGGAFLQTTSNIGEAEIDGVEGGVSWSSGSGLTLAANASYLSTEITEIRATDAVNIVGDELDYSPEWSYTLSASQDFHWGASTPGFARIDFLHRDAVSYIDRSSFLPSALPQFSDDLNLLNARLGATLNGVDLQLFALNLTDENAAIDPYQNWSNANRTRPRVIGVSFGYNF